MIHTTRSAVEARRLRLEDQLSRLLPDLPKWGVKKVILFGSFARGEARSRSDLDLLIIQETSKRFLDRLDMFYKLIDPQVAVDILVYTPEEFERMRAQSPFIQHILKEGRILYEAES